MPRILVADDNTNIQKMVSLAFEERGIRVFAVGNGEAAVRRLPDLNPDLVLADVFMPVRNGYEVCEFVKKDTRFSHVPVILLVGAFDPLDEKEARRVGADGVLKKPFVPPDPLIAMVTSALEKNPKLAAELSRLKETPPEPPPPPEIPLSTRKRREPPPLPKFPEPTGEEAEQIYSFGTAQRSLEQETGESGGPQAEAEEREAQEEEFDGAATASDWRRDSKNFEIPGDIADRPAFSPEQDFSPITFPSERDVPPRRVEEEPEPKEESEAQSPWPVSPSAEPPAIAPEPAETEPVAHAEAPAETRETLHTEPEEVPSEKYELEQEPTEPSIAEKGSDPRLASNAAEWMEMMAPPPAPQHPYATWAAEISSAGAPTAAPPSDSGPATTQDRLEAVLSKDSPLKQPEKQPQAPSESPLGASSVVSSDLLTAPADTPASMRRPSSFSVDPDLEPEEPEKPGPYNSQHEEAASPYEFLPPSPAVIPPGPDNASESDAEEPSERIPTAEPPSREALLAEVPFLSPPPPPAPADSGTVDALVQKVLEKLEPHLRDLLSKRVVKPLVEDILHHDSEEKDK